MAQSKKQLENLKKGNPATQFKRGRDAVENANKGNEAKRQKRKRRQSLSEAAQFVSKLPINEIGLNSLRRRGIDVDSIPAEDLVGVMALAMGQLAAGINGNSQAAQVFADWLDLPAKHKRTQLELEKLQAEIDRLRSGEDADDDQVLQFIEGMKHGTPDAEAD